MAPSNIPYNPIEGDAPPSPNPHRAQVYDPVNNPSNIDLTDVHYNDEPPMSQLPPGAAHPQPQLLPPRFQGQGINEPGFRSSYASSQVSLNAPSYQTADYDSVHGLNFNQQHRPTTSLTSTAAAGGLGSPLLPSERYHDDPYSHGNESAGAIPLSPVGTGQGYREFPEKREQYTSPRQQSKRRFWLILGIIILALLIIAAVGIPVYIFVIKPRLNSTTDGAKTDGGSHTGTGNTGTGTNGSKDPTDDAVVMGYDGSTVTTENGTTFTYKNSFGGASCLFSLAVLIVLETKKHMQTNLGYNRLLVLRSQRPIQQLGKGPVVHPSSQRDLGLEQRQGLWCQSRRLAQHRTIHQSCSLRQILPGCCGRVHSLPTNGC